jgi:hypothetical protein
VCFSGSSLSFLRCLFCVMGKRSSMIGSVMVAPKHLIVHDYTTLPWLGANIFVTPNHHHHHWQRSSLPDGQHGTAIVNFQAPSLLHVFTKFHSNFHSRGSYFSLQRLLPHPICLLHSAAIPHRCSYSHVLNGVTAHTDNLVLHTGMPHMHALTNLPVTKVVLTTVPAGAHCHKIQMQGYLFRISLIHVSWIFIPLFTHVSRKQTCI